MPLQPTHKNDWSKAKKDEMFIQRFLPHIDSLYNFALHLLNDVDAAKDLIQESYERAYRYINYYDPAQDAKPWLVRIVKNTFITHYRKQQIRPFIISLEENYQIAKDDEKETLKNADLRQELFSNMVGDEILNGVNSLPINFRLVILLFEIEGFNYAEIARILDVPIGTVRSRLSRARTQLKINLKEYAAKKGYLKKSKS